MLLTATVFLPLAGAAVILLLLGDNARRVRLFAAAVGVADFLLAILVFARYDRDIRRLSARGPAGVVDTAARHSVPPCR